MKKIIFILVLLIPITVFAQIVNKPDTTDTNQMTSKWYNPDMLFRNFNNGDTILNLNSLNNGIKSYQVPEESKKIIIANGLEVKTGGVVVIAVDTLLKKDFSFDVKTNASDKEWYENTIKIQVKNNNITLINVTSDKIEMATGFRKEGKIYVVVAVSMILFGIIILYLIFMERKVKKLERMLKDKN